MRHIAIIGGGFTGTAVATHLLASVPAPLDIVVIEPREILGGGLAYSGNDPDHRVNGTHELLVLFPDDIGHFARWYENSGASAQDPKALGRAGVRYVRRSDVRSYMNDTLSETLAKNAFGSTVRHIQDLAVAANYVDERLLIELTTGRTIEPDLAVLALGGQQPAPPKGISASAEQHPDYIGDPFDSDAISKIPLKDPVLLVGTGLTAADVVATLERQGHQGPITAISRRGLLPQPQGEAPNIPALLERLARPVPRFIERHGEGLSLRAAVRALRRDLASAIIEGRDQKEVFDEARDASAWLWPTFTTAEKRRFLRHLKPWYDVNRYRMVPQTGDSVARMVESGQLIFRTARLVGLDVLADGLQARLVDRGGSAADVFVGTVINCTGPQSVSNEPFIKSLCDLGLAQRDCLELGLEVDGEGRVLDRDGHAQTAIWAFGLLTRGRFGDMTAIPQIAFRLHRSLPTLSSAIADIKDTVTCGVLR